MRAFDKVVLLQQALGEPGGLALTPMDKMTVSGELAGDPGSMGLAAVRHWTNADLLLASVVLAAVDPGMDVMAEVEVAAIQVEKVAA